MPGNRGATDQDREFWQAVPKPASARYNDRRKEGRSVSFDPILLAPEKEEKEIVPYRPIWRSAVTEIVILLAVTAAILIIARVYKGSFADSQRRLIGIGMALLPLSLWGLVSYRGERRAPQPRARILTVVILTGLVAKAIGVPLGDGLFA